MYGDRIGMFAVPLMAALLMAAGVAAGEADGAEEGSEAAMAARAAGEIAVEITVSPERLRFGDPVTIEISVAGTGDVAVYVPQDLMEHRVFFMRDGQRRPVFWAAPRKTSGKPMAVMRDGRIIYSIRDVYLLPGEYRVGLGRVEGEGRGALGHTEVTVEKNPLTGMVEAFDSAIKRAMKENTREEEDLLMRDFRRFVLGMGEAAPMVVKGLLDRNAKNEDRTSKIIKVDMVVMLGGMLETALSRVDSPVVAAVPAADLLRLLSREASAEVAYQYLMILKFVEDRMTDDDQTAFDALIGRFRARLHPQVVFGAYMAAAGNGKYRRKHGDLPQAIRENQHMANVEKGMALDYYAKQMKGEK